MSTDVHAPNWRQMPLANLVEIQKKKSKSNNKVALGKVYEARSAEIKKQQPKK